MRPGDLVEPGPEVQPPVLVNLPPPSYPLLARRASKQASILVRVLVDENGRVADARRPEGTKPAGYGFDDAAIEAARKATYKPAMKKGVRVKIWAVLQVNFRLD